MQDIDFYSTLSAKQALRGHVNKKKIKKSEKTSEVGGWVKSQLGKKKIGKLYFYFYYVVGKVDGLLERQ